ncbi:MAG: hypothetical protein ABR889_07965 [Acidobacteriaceae bacterium]|jgi:hypothetical protein
MHIHPAAIGLHPINSSAAGNERAAAAQRGADVRKRLLKAAQRAAAAATPEENLLIGQWLDSRHSQVLPGDEYHSASQGEDPDFG